MCGWRSNQRRQSDAWYSTCYFFGRSEIWWVEREWHVTLKIYTCGSMRLFHPKFSTLQRSTKHTNILFLSQIVQSRSMLLSMLVSHWGMGTSHNIYAKGPYLRLIRDMVWFTPSFVDLTFLTLIPSCITSCHK